MCYVNKHYKVEMRCIIIQITETPATMETNGTNDQPVFLLINQISLF